MKYYRIEDKAYSNGVDVCGDPLPGHHIGLTLLEFDVIKETPKGVWIQRTFGDFKADFKRFVLTSARKRYACPTLEEAKTSFRARKKKQISIYSKHISDAEDALAQVDWFNG